MVDQNTFMETLHLVQEIAKTTAEPMERETALSYFKDMELSPEQQEMVYQFLLLPEEETGSSEEGEETGETAVSNDEDTAGYGDAALLGSMDMAGIGKEVGQNRENRDSTPHFQMYLDEIDTIAQLVNSEEEALYRRLFSGDLSVIEDISHQWLKRVVAIAEEYKGRGALLDDLVQEGNIGLLLKLNELFGSPEENDGGKRNAATEVPGLLKSAVKEAIEQYLAEENGEDQQNETILGKVTLVHQAQDYLTKEKGEKPSQRELSEYTKIPVEEINDIMSLYPGRF